MINFRHNRCNAGRILLRAMLVCFCAAVPTNEAHAALSTRVVVNAIQSRICFEAFWWDRSDFNFGKTVPITLRKTDNVAYAWSERLASVPGVAKWANFFSVYAFQSRAIVGLSYGFNVNAMRAAPTFQAAKTMVFKGTGLMVDLHIPRHCNPRFARDTPLKEKMLKNVETSIASELALFERNGGPKLPTRVRVIIANFNPDYPETVALVPATGQIFHVALHDAYNPRSDTFLESGEYPVQPEYSKSTVTELVAKIRKYGLDREIRVAENSPTPAHPTAPSQRQRHHAY